MCAAKKEPKKIEDKKARRYRLKTMVFARLFAELTVMIIFILLPLALLLTGQFALMPATAKAVILTICILSVLLLPAYAFITWSVKVDHEGITAIAPARKQNCSWSSIKRITRRSNWNWVRYVIEHENGELSFPIWLKDCDELVEEIKKKLPRGAGDAGSLPMFRKFSQDPISMFFQLLQAGLGIALVVVFWLFFGELTHEKTTSRIDSLIVLGFCLIVSALFLWRTFVVLLMPKSVRLTGQDVIVETMFFCKNIPWPEVEKVAPALPFLPEGFMLATKRGSYLIGNGMNSLDELVESLKKRLEAPQIGEAQPVKSKSKKLKRRFRK